MYRSDSKLWQVSPRALTIVSVLATLAFMTICASVLLDIRTSKEELARQSSENLAATIDADLSRNLTAPGPRALIEELRRRDGFFADAWEAHAVIEREGGERTFNHPDNGFLRYQQVTFNLAGHAGIKLVILTPAD